MQKSLAFFFLLSITGMSLQAQDTLPRFTVKNAGNNRIIVGWVNAYPAITQISIQRSSDSLFGYQSIFTVPDPSNPQNGYVDTKAPKEHVFYRLYILLGKGVYLFSDPRLPVLDTMSKRIDLSDKIGKLNPAESINGPTLISKPPSFLPSIHVFTNNDGNISVKLPDGEKLKDYSIRFFNEKTHFLFELKDLKTRTFKIDKAAFLHAGWFFFEMYEEGKLVEKSKFYLDKDF